MQQIGPVEWIIILAVVLLLFGVGRVSKLGSELGSAISAFRQGLKDGQADEQAEDDKDKA